MFLRFFESKGHLRLPSFSLIPQNDKSILLINAGMTPMKPWFKGEEEMCIRDRLEGVLAGELCLALSLVLGEHIGKDLHAAVDGLGKILLLGADDLGDIALLLAQILICLLYTSSLR